MSDIKTKLGKRIQEIRKKKGMSQEKLAELVGIEPNNISHIEKGKNYPTPENIAKIARALDKEVYELYLFNHFKPYEEIRLELINALQDENTARLLYKFYSTINT